MDFFIHSFSVVILAILAWLYHNIHVVVRSQILRFASVGLILAICGQISYLRCQRLRLHFLVPLSQYLPSSSPIRSRSRVMSVRKVLSWIKSISKNEGRVDSLATRLSGYIISQPSPSQFALEDPDRSHGKPCWSFGPVDLPSAKTYHPSGSLDGSLCKKSRTILCH